MRGYFDGDGSVWTGKLKNGRTAAQLYFGVRGTVDFLTSYRQVLESNTSVEPRNTPIPLNNGIGKLEYGGNGVACSIRDFLYRDASIYLQRKYDRFHHPDVRSNARIMSPVTIQAATQAKLIPVVARCIKTGTEESFASIKETAPKFHPGLVSDCLRGVQKTHRGHVFKKADGEYPAPKTHQRHHDVPLDSIVSKYKELKNIPGVAGYFGLSYEQVHGVLPADLVASLKSAAHDKRRKPIVATCMETGADRIMPGLTSCAEYGFIKSAVSYCLSGKQKTHRGHTFKRLQAG